ncbi:MAG: DNA polymerase Y family protein [Rhodoferax sp.]
MFWLALQALPDSASPELTDHRMALGWWALQFTPKVARIDDVLVLELSASERLWRGRASLLGHMLESDKPVAKLRYAQGSTSLLAFARLQTASPEAAMAPDDLPLATLTAAHPYLDTLEKMGCSRWGQLRALPRGGVARRFGAGLLDALDRAYGEKPDCYMWLQLPDMFEATLELGAQVETASALLFGACRLFNQLQFWLQARQLGVLSVALSWTMDSRRHTANQGELVLRSAEAGTDTVHLQRLLGEKLSRIILPAPVLYLHLRSLETETLSGKTASLLADEQAVGDNFQQMLERLSARLGSQQVLQVRPCAEHRPERMQDWQSASEATRQFLVRAGGTRTGGQEKFKIDSLYPTWLLAAPLRLTERDRRPQYCGPLILLAGPQRLEANWWSGSSDCALRDYFVARSEQGGLLWIYRERLARPSGRADADSKWYLHGFFA